MLKHFSLEYWIDDGWYVGHLTDIPGVFSQGETLEELQENIKDAYQMMRAEESNSHFPNSQTVEIGLEV